MTGAEISMEILYLATLFSNCLSKYIPFSSYEDEILLAVLLLLFILKVCRSGAVIRGWNGYDVRLAVTLALLMLTGTAGTIFNGKEVQAEAVVKDIVLAGKFFAAFLCAKTLFLSAEWEKIMRKIRKITRIAVVVIFVCGILSLFVDIGMGDQIRFGLRSYQFLYTHYTFLVYAEVVMTAVLCSDAENDNRIYTAMAMGTMLLTLRTKAVVFCIVVLLFFFMEKFGKKIRLRWYLLAGGAGVAAAWGKISEYLSWGFSYNMRNGLYLAGAKLAAALFPIGTGFAGFGSNLSYEYNPRIYYELGLNTYQGFDVGRPVLSDVFWPYVYGEFGVLGLALYLAMLAFLFWSLRHELGGELEKLRGANIIFAYLLVASMAEAVFTNSSGVYSAVILAFFFRKKRESAPAPAKPFVIRL